MRSSPIGYRPDVDGLRALAILPVLCYHAFPSLLPGGFVGVDVFFVISGFLITSIILASRKADRFSYADFYARRIVRIFPALVLVLATTLGLGAWLSTPSEWQDQSRQVIAGSAFVSNLFLWRTIDYFGADFVQQPLLHLWSLGVEEQFYLVWPLVLVFFAGFLRTRIAIVAAIATVSFVVDLALVARDPQAAFYLPVTRMWELSAGGLVALCQQACAGRAAGATPRPGIANELLSVLGVGLVVFAAMRLSDKLAFAGACALLPVGGAIAVVLAGPNAWLNRHVLGSKPFVWIGLISYPLYLWHLPLLYASRAIETETAQGARLSRLGLMLLAVVLATLTYRWLEQPMRRLSPRTAVGSLSAAMVCCVVLAGAVIAGGGFPGRYDSAQAGVIAQQEAARGSYAADYREGRCFIVKGAAQQDVDASCLPPDGALAVWGDSYAAHLIPGLQGALGTRAAGLGQLTAGACAPFTRVDARSEGPICAGIEERLSRRLIAAKPAIVILSASWIAYANEPGFVDRLTSTVRDLQKHGAAVVLVGQAVAFGAPQWIPAMRHTDAATVPDPALPALRVADGMVRSVATATGVPFFSPLEALCVARACAVQARLGGRMALMSWDTGHLTVWGSRWYAARILEMPPVRSWAKS